MTRKTRTRNHRPRGRQLHFAGLSRSHHQRQLLALARTQPRRQRHRLPRPGARPLLSRRHAPDHRHVNNGRCRRNLTTAVRPKASAAAENRFYDPSAATRPKADGLRRQPGQKPPDHQNPGLTMAMWKDARKPALTTAVQSKPRNPATIIKTPSRVVALRSKHGYSVTKHDASVAKSQKTLRRQFGRNYDQRKVRNK